MVLNVIDIFTAVTCRRSAGGERAWARPAREHGGGEEGELLQQRAGGRAGQLLSSCSCCSWLLGSCGGRQRLRHAWLGVPRLRDPRLLGARAGEVLGPVLVLVEAGVPAPIRAEHAGHVTGCGPMRARVTCWRSWRGSAARTRPPPRG